MRVIFEPLVGYAKSMCFKISGTHPGTNGNREEIDNFTGLAPLNVSAKNAVRAFFHDSGADDICAAIKRLTKKSPSKTASHVHIVGNLYMVLTPLKAGGGQSTIEDFLQTKSKTLSSAQRHSIHKATLTHRYISASIFRLNMSVKTPRKSILEASWACLTG